MESESVLNSVTLVLVVGFLIVSVITWNKTTKTAYAVKVTMCFLLVAVNLMLDKSFLIILWSIVMVLNMIGLALTSNENT